jgi:Tfp pilus assembly protein PilN
MTNNTERTGSGAVPAPDTEGAAAPSCYRVSVLSDSLEVSARLRCADDLELLMRVLEANKGLFPEAGAISDRDRRKRNQNVSENGRIKDRRICDGGPRD